MLIEERHLQIRGLLQEIAQAREFVLQAAVDAGLSIQAVHHCQLAVDEVCTNIVEHGYGARGGEHVIDIICRQETYQFSIIISDDSAAFDPMQRPDPDPETSLEDREIGGWGIYFVKRLMDEVIYHREGGQNHLTMIKRLVS